MEYFLNILFTTIKFYSSFSNLCLKIIILIVLNQHGPIKVSDKGLGLVGGEGVYYFYNLFLH